MTDEVDRDVAAALAGDAPRVVYVASQADDWWNDRVVNAVRARGFTRVQREANHGSRLIICEKP